MQESKNKKNVGKGKIAEQEAIDYLKTKNYTILDRNSYHDHAELDIVAIDKMVKQVVFVEVKSQKSDFFGAPELQITPQKIRHLYRAAELWLWQHRMHNEACRFDVIAISEVKGKKKVVHYENAFVMGR
jgi:putative endonuclease